MGKYTNASHVMENEIGISSKSARGWNKIYDIISDTLSNVDHVVEIGVGYGHAQLAWACTFPEAKSIVGIDVAAPSRQLCERNSITVGQYVNAENGINLLHNSDNPIPLRILRKLDIYYNKDAYEPEVAKLFSDEYNQFSLVVNDGKQASYIWQDFFKSWHDKLTDDGILVQEKIGRERSEGVCYHYVEKAINNGWRVFDMREYHTEDTGNKDADGLIAVWYKNSELWGDKFDGLLEVKKPSEHYPPLISANPD